MTVEDIKQIDFTTLARHSNDVGLIICDHLPWDEDEGEHLLTLQDKLNSYLAFIESGEIYEKLPRAVGRKITIEVVGKFPLSDEAKKFYRLAGKAIEDAGFSLRFRHLETASE